jgi:predicted GH43/DUF377 family glycosyl hydrolase
MYFSWRSKRSIALTESDDGFKWSEPEIVLVPTDQTWQWEVNRQSVVKKDGVYHMWYNGMSEVNLNKMEMTGVSKVGYAVSKDGVTWERRSEPVMVADQEWEQESIMCPFVIWNDEKKIYQMYYSAGGNYEPIALGYAESIDGLKWTKHQGPIFCPIYKNLWERERTTACQVLYHKGWYYMFYIGFEDIHKARVCAARSGDGKIWERHPLNPLIGPGPIDAWDCEAAYKPFVVWEEKNKRWLMWVNCRKGFVEQIGVMIHDGEDLGFDEPVPDSPVNDCPVEGSSSEKTIKY